MDKTSYRISWNTLISLLSRVGTRVLKLIGSIIFADIAGAAALGIFYVFTSMYRVGRRLTSLGMGQVIITYVSKAQTEGAPEKVGQVVASALVVRFIPLVILSILIFLFTNSIDGYIGIKNGGLYLVILVFISVIFSTARSTLSGLKRVDLASSLDVSRELFVTGTQICLVILGLKAFGLIVGFIGGMFFATILSLVLTLSRIRGLIPSLERARSMVQFAKFSFLDNLVGGEQLWLDTLLLGLFVGTFVTQAQIGIYGIAYSISMFGFTLSAAIGQAILPEISGFETVNAEETRDKAIRESLRYATMLSIPLMFGAVAVGDLVLDDVFGFNSGATLLIFLTAGAVPFSAYQPIHQVFYGLNRPEWAFSVSLATAILNVVLNLGLIPLFGTAGVAVSTSLAMLLAFILGYGLLQYIGLKKMLPIKSWLIQFSSAIAMAGTVIGLKGILSVRSRMATVSFVCVGAIVYGTLLLAGEPSVRHRIFEALP